MGPIVALLLLAVAWHGVDTKKATEDPILEQKLRNGCSLFCFIDVRKDERVDFSLYSNLSSCTHFVYGFGHMTDEYQYKGPSWQDEVTHSYSGNFYHLRTLKRTNPSASILLGVHLAEHDSYISYPPNRRKLAYSALKEARSLHADGLFFRVDRPFIDNSRFAHFFKDLSTSNNTLPVTLGVPLPLLSHSMRHVVDAAFYVETVYIVSTPRMQRLAHVDPLFPSEVTPPEQTISHHVKELAAKGVPRRKIVIGLTTGAVVYTNYIVHNSDESADGRLASLQETCGLHGERILDNDAASVMIRSGYSWISSNVPSEASLGKKVRWLTSAGYGGIGMQSLNRDDPKAECDKESKTTFPALRFVTANLECKREQHVKPCTRLCYINSEKPLYKLPVAACSHLVIEATLSALGEVKLSPEGTETATWLHNMHVYRKPSLMISLGSRVTSDIWRHALATPYYREKTINHLQELMVTWRASGVEVSWTLGNLDYSQDSASLYTLLTEMRTAMGANTTIALAATWKSSFTKKYMDDMPRLDKIVDLVVLHAHRFHSSDQIFTGHHSTMFYTSDILPDLSKSVEGLVVHWVTTQKMPRSQIVIGITPKPLSMTLKGEDRVDDQSPFGMNAIPSNPFLRSGNKEAVYGKTVCELSKDERTRKVFSTSLGIPFLVNDGQFVAYESERSVHMKAAWTSMSQLGGIALFDTELDDAEGECTIPFPLLNTIVKAQMCQTCVREDVDGLPCTDSFTTSCNFNLPTAGQKYQMPISMLPNASCTQIVIEHLILQSDGSIVFQDNTAREAMRELVQPQLGMKPLIMSVRCHKSMTNEEFYEILKNGPSTVRTLLSFMANYSMSGIEIACDNVANAKSKDAFASFLTGLRSALIESTPFKECPRSLSLRLPFHTHDLATKYDLAVLNSIHHVVLEAFTDAIRDNENSPLINSPLFSSNSNHRDIDTIIRAWHSEGLEKSKVIIQIPAYALIQTITSNSTEINVATQDVQKIDQEQLCTLLKYTPTTTMYDRIVSYAVVFDGVTRKWVTFQDRKTVSYTISYVIRERLGGASLLSLNYDDWDGRCGSGPFPMLAAVSARCAAHSRPNMP